MTAQSVAAADTGDIAAVMRGIGAAAREAAQLLALASADAKNGALRAAAAALRADRAAILEANARDLAAAERRGLGAALLDRLKLDAQRVDAIARGLEEVAAQPDPVGSVLAEWTRPNGLRIRRVRVPLGVVGIIYESRPNVTADAGSLCLKAGNAAILRGGSESFHSSRAIHACLARGLAAADLPASAIQLVPTTDRAAVGELLRLNAFVDVIVPRGGRSLIERVMDESRIPVLAHLDGNCHSYVDGAADLAMARSIVLNAKMRRTGICGATETLLVDRACAGTHLVPILEDLAAAGCEIRGCAETRALYPAAKPAVEADWNTEYLDAIIAVRIVDGIDGAIAHVNRHGSHHTDAIITADQAAAARFLAEVDSGIVLHNASTQFADGGEFGMGAEIGIATGKLHARGPVGAEQLTSYKYQVLGSGQTRP
ncbi:MAG: gamma-glutamyl phosphate reductase [Alphaproteobacteria bacterium]|nr:MAG: gamma-glutamyl phosphate reductase [Alphaproteobacteria bacterium]